MTKGSVRTSLDFGGLPRTPKRNGNMGIPRRIDVHADTDADDESVKWLDVINSDDSSSREDGRTFTSENMAVFFHRVRAELSESEYNVGIKLLFNF